MANERLKIRGEDRRPACETGARGITTDVEYERCGINGPAVFVLDHSIYFEGANVMDVDLDQAFTSTDRPIYGAVPLHNVVFRGCHFMGVGFVGPADLIEVARKAFPR